MSMPWLIRARTRAPNVLRVLYRAAHAFRPVPQSIEIPDNLLDGCKCVSNRVALISKLPSSSRVAELGTFKGEFAKQILLQSSPVELHLVDVDFSRLNPEISSDRRVVCHRGYTQNVLTEFDDAYFDWIYVDADHSYEGTLRDAKLSAPKVRSGGFLVFNDFAHLDPAYGRYGVHRAVSEFAVSMQWPFAFLAFAGNGLYDVALRKP
jgi:predicted O-methyltransferase YrrM